jgi:hypothetical protein
VLSIIQSFRECEVYISTEPAYIILLEYAKLNRLLHCYMAQTDTHVGQSGIDTSSTCERQGPWC